MVEAGAVLAGMDDREARLLRERAATELKLARATAENDVTVRFAKLAAAVAKAELLRAQESNEKFPRVSPRPRSTGCSSWRISPSWRSSRRNRPSIRLSCRCRSSSSTSSGLRLRWNVDS